MSVLDELAAAIVQEFDTMWASSTDGDQQEEKRSSPSEFVVFDRTRTAEKEEVAPMTFSFPTNVSMEGIAKIPDNDDEAGSKILGDRQNGNTEE